MSEQFRYLLSRHVGSSFAKQLAFADFLGERSWGVDISEGTALFGDELSFPIQLLGTEADGDLSWLWAWANTQINLPQDLLVSCNDMKQLGLDNEIMELTERSFSQNVADGHMIAMVASGLNQNCCYYRGPYEGGALYFLVCDIPDTLRVPVTPEQAITVINQSISQFDIDHQVMVTEFLQQQLFSVTTERNIVRASRDNSDVTLSFDSQGCIEKIGGSLTQA